MSKKPSLVFADLEGKIYDWSELEMVGRGGKGFQRLETGDWIPLPEGSELFLLPRRYPVGYHPQRRTFETLSRNPFDRGKPVQAVAAFVAPAHTQLFLAAYQTLPEAPLLPLFAYTAVGWLDGRFVAAALRIDSDQRQDFRHFDPDRIRRNARRRMERDRSNRLVQHLGKCALSYGCPAARNLFLSRWEAPLPTSPVCNARCLGCISLQERTGLKATQERIRFVPTPEEIAEVAVPHLKEAERAVVSFGQGCEGEPLLQGPTLEKSVKLMRTATPRGTIHLNTNGSLPRRVAKLCEEGLDSIRVSLNSCRPGPYQRYFRPRDYSFESLIESLKIVKSRGGFASINYFVHPGFTDSEEEWSAIRRFLDETRINLIQMRNLNIDPEWYEKSLGLPEDDRSMGMRRLIDRLRSSYPDVRLGYFNPPVRG